MYKWLTPVVAHSPYGVFDGDRSGWSGFRRGYVYQFIKISFVSIYCMAQLQGHIDANYHLNFFCSSVIYLFLVSILPAVYPLSSWQGIAHLLVAGWLAFNVFFNYFCCICTDPGSSPIISVRPQLLSTFLGYYTLFIQFLALELWMGGTDI